MIMVVHAMGEPGAPRELPAPGGGFQWSSSVTLVRDGKEIARADGWPVTWSGDYQNPQLGGDFERLCALARPGDRVLRRFVRFGNGGWESETEYVVVSV